jgi:hypothetical protein
MFFLEVIFVGLYSSILFNILSYCIYSPSILFLFGFFKHFLGYYLYLHTYYCNYGRACNNYYTDIKTKYKSYNKYIFFESIIESIWFLFCFKIFNIDIYTNNILIFIFLFGSITHILAEIFGLHKFYCDNRCIILKN